MRLLLDSHALLWLFYDSRRLRPEARAALDDPRNEVATSVASLWELATKVRAGKLDADVAGIAGRLAPRSQVALLPIAPEHLIAMLALPRHADHRDPTDLLLVATALREGMALVTRDAKLARYPVARLVC